MEKTMLGKRLRELRTRCGYTQADIAAFLDVDPSLISMYESGERQISIDILEKLGDLYCCDFTHEPDVVFPLRQVSFCTDGTKVSNMRAIQTVNRIVLNSIFMAGLLNGDFPASVPLEEWN